MPYLNEYACRIRNPDEFESGSFRRIKKGKLTIIVAKPKGGGGMSTQGFRYPKNEYTESEARAHCKEQNGNFEAKMQALEKKLSDAGFSYTNVTEGDFSDILKFIESQIIEPSVGTQIDWVDAKRYFESELERVVQRDIKPLQIFPALKGVKGYRESEAYNLPDLIDILKHACKSDTVCPCAVERKADGLRVLWWKHKDQVRVFLESGEVKTERFPKTVEELKKIPIETFVLDSETEMWIDGRHVGREDTAGYVNRKDQPDDENIVANVFDILFFSDPKVTKHDLNSQIGDLHNEPLSKRHQYLDLIDLKQAVDEKPKPSVSHFNRFPSHIINNEAELKKAVNLILNLAGSEGAMVKLLTSTYPLTGMTNEWAKFKTMTEVHVAVLKRLETRTAGVFVYEVGFLLTADFNPVEDDIREVKDRKFVYAGKTFNTSLIADPGDIITVLIHTLFWHKKEKGESIRVYEPRIFELRPEQRLPDTTKDAIEIAKRAGLLQIKESLSQTKLAAIMCAAPKNKDIQSGTPKQLWSTSKPIKSFISFCESHSIPYSVLSRKYGLVPSWAEIENYDFFDMNLAEWQLLLEESAKRYNVPEIIMYSRAYLVNTDFQEMLQNLKNVKFTFVSTLDELYKAFVKQETLDQYVEVEEAEFKVEEAEFKVEESLFAESSHFEISLIAWPPEDKTYSSVWQYHFRGKSAHLDFRAEANGSLESFTLLNQVPDEIKEPVDTFAKGKATVASAKWKTDEEFFKVQAVKKAPQPKEWMTVQGVVSPGAVGATREYPGVFVIEDRGIVEFGARKAHMYEYFVHGRKRKGRYVATLIPNPYAPRPAALWFFMKPENQTPYVLSSRAIREGWLPPSGISSLPKSIRKRVPEDLMFWKSSGDEAQVRRKQLAEHFKEKLTAEVKVEASDTEFIIQYRWYRGPEIVRGGPSYEEWDMKISDMQFRLDADPKKETSMSVTEQDQVLRPQFWNTFEKPVELKPNTPENEKPNTPAFLVTHVKGRVDVLENGTLFKKFRFTSGLSGLWIMKRSTPQGIWDFERSELPEAEAKEAQLSEVRMKLAFQFIKPFEQTPDGLRVPGVALSPGVWNGIYFSEEVINDEPERILNIPVCIEHDFKKQVGKPEKVSFENNNIEVISLITDPEGIAYVEKEAKGYSIDAWIQADPVRKIAKKIKQYVELSLVKVPACGVCMIEKSPDFEEKAQEGV